VVRPHHLTLAGSTGLFCFLSGATINQAMVRAVTVMVISCPCALGVAIPMARLAGISLAGRRGILVREIEAFERADAVDTLVFDKTGTLTHGRWQLVGIDCQPGHDPATIAAWAAGLEQASDHDIARSIKDYARVQGISPARVTDVSVHPDGVRGQLEGTCLRIGSRGFAWGQAQSPDGARNDSDGTLTSRVFLSANRPAATLIFGDAIRPSVPGMVETLKQSAVDLHLVSGDAAASPGAVADTLGLTRVRGNLLPADKADYIDRLNQQGRHVAMVGDGVNDAAAMVRADLAVAVYSGAGTGQGGRPHHPHARRSRSIAGLFPLIPTGQPQGGSKPVVCLGLQPDQHPRGHERPADPPVAATAMLLSSLTVIGNTLLLVRRD
jgi:cation transport ATPase